MTGSCITFGTTRIHYDVVRRSSRQKTEIVIVDRDRIKVLVAEDKPDEEIYKIVKANSRWIFQKQLHMKEKTQNLTYSDGSKLPYLGKEYSLYVVDLNKHMKNECNDSFMFENGRFVARVTEPNLPKIRLLYERWLEIHGQRILEKRVDDYSKVIGLDPSGLKLRLKSQKNRVGSLGKNLVLNFNRNLLRLPLNIIDYVIVHELCHIHIPNHSQKYWHLLGIVMPDYEFRKEWLSKNCQLVFE